MLFAAVLVVNQNASGPSVFGTSASLANLASAAMTDSRLAAYYTMAGHSGRNLLPGATFKWTNQSGSSAPAVAPLPATFTNGLFH
jgi:hypothetical protein